MLFSLDKPFSQHDIDQAISTEKNRLAIAHKKSQRCGVIILLAGLILFSIIGINFSLPTEKDFLTYIFSLLWFFVGLTLIISPYILKQSGINSLFLLPYSIASIKKTHDCEAFIHMPSMEQYKNYVEAVIQQPRQLINIECDAIIQYWDSLDS